MEFSGSGLQKQGLDAIWKLAQSLGFLLGFLSTPERNAARLVCILNGIFAFPAGLCTPSGPAGLSPPKGQQDRECQGGRGQQRTQLGQGTQEQT